MFETENEKRINKLCEVLKEYWRTVVPDWRLGQFISNILYERAKSDKFYVDDAHIDIDSELFYIHDDDLIEAIKDYFSKY